MSKEELTIRDRLEDILESIELIQEWSKLNDKDKRLVSELVKALNEKR